MSFVIYDTETTGLNAPFDQLLQFAAILTDNEFNPVDHFEIRTRLLPHVVPSPKAMMLTGTTVDDLTNSDLPSFYDATCKLRDKLLSWSPAVFAGYNSYRFDEHFLRQSFYKALYPPYLTNTNGNARTDVMRLVYAASIFCPKHIVIPGDDAGRQSFDLVRVAQSNGFNEHNAHDALSDAHATVYLCRLLMERAPELWSTFVRFSQKAAVVDYIENESVFSLSDVYFGRPHSWYVTALGANSTNRSEYYVLDLATEPRELAKLHDASLASRLRQYPKPIRRLKCNGAPIVMPADEAPEIARRSSLELDELERRAEYLHENVSLRDRLLSVFESLQDVREPSSHVEEQIYDSFPSAADEQVMEEFHRTPWDQRLGLLDRLQDTRMQVLGKQLFYFERPDLLDEETLVEVERVLSERVMMSEGNSPWLTLQGAIDQLDRLVTESDEYERELLISHRAYLSRRMNDGPLNVGNGQ